MKNKPVLYIMIGIPGSGKSSFAKFVIKQSSDAVIVSRDEIRFSMIKDSDAYFAKENEVFKQYINRIKSALKEGKDVIADATHLNPGSRYKLYKALGLDKNDVCMIGIVMKVSLERCLSQNLNREGRELVPEDVIKNMYSNFLPPDEDEFEKYLTTVYYVTDFKMEE